MIATAIPDRVREIFSDAREMQAQAIKLFDSGDVRDAAEQGWCDAEVLAIR